MAELMWRVVKRAGVGNVALEQVALPELGPRQVLVRVARSLISRGSELWRRYAREEAVDPESMGYSTAGTIVRVGSAVHEFTPGDRVACVAPHAEFAVGDVDSAVRRRVTLLPNTVSFEAATFHSLLTSGFGWTAAVGIRPEHTVVVLGLGLVGNLVYQAAQRFFPRLLIGVDLLSLRCTLARQVGAGRIVNGTEADPVATVQELTQGRGADIVIDCVGGRAGVSSFAQAQEMLAPGGLLQLIGLYHDMPLPLDAGRMMQRRLLGGYPPDTDVRAMAHAAVRALAAAAVHVEPLITHRFSAQQAKEAFDLLHNHPESAMGVVLVWDEN